MKVDIGPFVEWIGPYQIAEKILFWIPKYDKDGNHNELVHSFGTWLSGGENKEGWLTKLCEWIHSKQKRRVKIKLHPYDTWNMDGTMSLIILPMLKQLKAAKHGSPQVDAEDVPFELQHIGQEDYSGQQRLDFGDFDVYEKLSWDITHQRWDWVMSEIIWAFEQMQPDCDWEEQYRSGETDLVWEVSSLDADGKPLTYKMGHGPKDTFKVDWASREKHAMRIANGLRLFGKYFQGLWD